MVTSLPFTLVVFGATGDLMHRKLMPAIAELIAGNHIGKPPMVIGVGRRKISDHDFRVMMKEAVGDHAGWDRLSPHIFYQQGFFEDKELYERLKKTLGAGPRFFYLATPPQHYGTILTSLESSRLSLDARVLIEKPFGKDLVTAQKLERLLSSIFSERQIYRIDHYLDKESVQNILALRFANGIFEPTWNKTFIDHVQISLLESSGVSRRGAFYDGIGALRDVVQNHMLQMLAFTAMDQPIAFDSENLRKNRQQVLSSLQPIRIVTDVIRGQYDGYKREKNVDTGSHTETYIALKLFLNTSRWKGVPFYLRTGKNLKDKVTEISLHFKKPIVCTGPLCLFPEPQVMRNVLVIRISPDTGMGLRLMAKKPGFGMSLQAISMKQVRKGTHAVDNEYEKLLLDAIRGDQTLFAHSSEVEASWRFITKILDGFTKKNISLSPYSVGGWGPKEADEFIEKDGRHWFLS